MLLSLEVAVVQLCSITKSHPSEDTPCHMLRGDSDPETGREGCWERV